MNVGAAPPPLPPRLPEDLPDLRERRAWTRDALQSLAEGRGSRRRERGDSRFGDVYIVVATVVVALAMGGSFASRVFTQACSDAVCRSGASQPVFTLAVALIAVGSLLVLAHLLGPAGLSAPRRSWPGAAPTDRALLVGGPLAGVATIGGVVGLVGGLLGTLALTAGRPSGTLLLLGCAVGACVGVAEVVVVGLAQGTRVARLLAALGRGLIGCGVLLAAGVTLRPRLLDPIFARVPVPGPPSAGVLLAALGVGAVVIAAGVVGLPRRMRRLTGPEVARGGDALDALTSSVLMVDATAVTLLRSAGATGRRGRFRSRSLRGHGLGAALGAELRRLRRRRTPLWQASWLLAPPVLAGGLLGRVPTLVVTTLCAVAVAFSAADGLRLWTRSTAIRRFYPAPAWAVRLVHLLVPAVLLLVWGTILVALGTLAPIDALVILIAALGGVLRSAPEPALGYSTGLDVATPMGPLPLGLAVKMFRGVDVALVPLVALLLFGPTFAIVVAAYTIAVYAMKN